MLQTFKCLDCKSTRLIIVATSTGWKVNCRNGHEVFPHEETIFTTEGDVFIRSKY